MTIKRHESLAFRLTVWYMVILFVMIVLAGVFLYQGFRMGLLHDLDERLLEIADNVYDVWREERGVTWTEAIQTIEARYPAEDLFVQTVELSEGRDKPRELRTIHRARRLSPGTYTFDPEVYYNADRAEIDELVYETIDEQALSGYPIRVLLFPVRGPIIVQVGISLQDTDRASSRLVLIMALAGGILLLLASLGGSFFIRKALHPVKSVVRAARDISADDLSHRIESKMRKDEIGELVGTFNEMIDRLEVSVNKIKQFSGDVSHELRTPLTIIRGEIEVLLRKERKSEDYKTILRSVLEEAAQMEKIIDDLLFLSRIEAAEKKGFDKVVSLDEILIEAFENRRTAAKKKEIDYQLGDLQSAEIRGDRVSLERMVVNLIDNALRYTPAGKSVTASLAVSARSCVLAVRDTGIGIPESALPHIFDRFYVVDRSRSKETGGSGLGLSIVKRVADAHRARIRVESREGEGSVFEIVFEHNRRRL